MSGRTLTQGKLSSICESQCAAAWLLHGMRTRCADYHAPVQHVLNAVLILPLMSFVACHTQYAALRNPDNQC